MQHGDYDDALSDGDGEELPDLPDLSLLNMKAPPYASSGYPGHSSPDLAGALESISKAQELMAQRLLELNTGPPGILQSEDPSLGGLGLGAVKSAREREAYRKRIQSNPESIYNEWWVAARAESGVEERGGGRESG